MLNPCYYKGVLEAFNTQENFHLDKFIINNRSNAEKLFSYQTSL